MFFGAEEIESELITQGQQFKEMWGPLNLLFLLLGAMAAQ